MLRSLFWVRNLVLSGGLVLFAALDLLTVDPHISVAVSALESCVIQLRQTVPTSSIMELFTHLFIFTVALFFLS